MIFQKFPSYIQSESKDCGPSCLKIISQYYGKSIDIEYIRELSETTRTGTSLTGLIKAAEVLGFYAIGRKETYLDLKNNIPLPVIAHWNQDHYVVVYKATDKHIYVSDPELGKLRYSKDSFIENWIGKQSNEDEGGIIMHLQPLKEFYNQSYKNNFKKISSQFLKNQLKGYQWDFFKISLLVLVVSILDLFFPYITKRIIDEGVKNKDVHFVFIASLAYVGVFLGYKISNIIRNWIVIKLSMNLNIRLISSFIKKLTLLPISYFDSKLTGDLFQRIRDHDNLEQFFTSKSILALFSLLSVIIFSGLFLWYDYKLFLAFFFGTLIHLGWIMLFFRKRKVLDFKFFSLKSKENSKLIELINGMQEIKLNGCENEKIKDWKEVKTKLYERDMQSLKIEQFQLDGAAFINEVKNVTLILLASILVINNQLSLGQLIAVSYIIGRLNSPINQIVSFLNNIQDIRLGFRRIMEIHNRKEEITTEQNTATLLTKITGDITFKNVSFRYTGTSKNILNNISFVVPKNKITAIVGPSGSGKTTILKLILKFYELNDGAIYIGNNNLEKINHKRWRSKCGVVMQEGFIFNDTILNNITVSLKLDKDKLTNACKAANIDDFINSLPVGYKTKIGNEGIDISTGQKQRLLMARALYKLPNFLFFDEATSALDAKNEQEISENLNLFFKNRTVLLIAHRLSTVKNADQIIVLSENGSIEEIGTHENLLNNKGLYYNLINNQLELS